MMAGRGFSKAAAVMASALLILAILPGTTQAASGSGSVSVNARVGHVLELTIDDAGNPSIRTNCDKCRADWESYGRSTTIVGGH